MSTSAEVRLTAVLILGRAFVVEQNLMVDVPLLALWLLFFELLLLHTSSPKQTRRHVLAGLVRGAAVLTKHGHRPGLPAPPFEQQRRGEDRQQGQAAPHDLCSPGGRLVAADRTDLDARPLGVGSGTPSGTGCSRWTAPPSTSGLGTG